MSAGALVGEEGRAGVPGRGGLAGTIQGGIRLVEQKPEGQETFPRSQLLQDSKTAWPWTSSEIGGKSPHTTAALLVRQTHKTRCSGGGQGGK